jgi:hypothetical protein
MDPIDRGMWFALLAPIYFVTTLWEMATDPTNSWYFRTTVFLLLIRIQWIFTYKEGSLFLPVQGH